MILRGSWRESLKIILVWVRISLKGGLGLKLWEEFECLDLGVGYCKCFG